MSEQYTFKNVLDAVENEGFEYAMVHYADWSSVKDEKFQELYTAFLNAHNNLEDYLNQ